MKTLIIAALLTVWPKQVARTARPTDTGEDDLTWQVNLLANARPRYKSLPSLCLRFAQTTLSAAATL